MAESVKIKKLRPWHEALVDYELENPAASGQEIAKHFGVTQSYLSIVRNSDIFVEYRMKRRESLNKDINKAIADKVGAVAEKSLDMLSQKLDAEPIDKVPLRELRETAAMSLNAMGFGQPKDSKREAALNLQINVGSGDLERAREKVRNMTLENTRQLEDNREGGEEAAEILPAPAA